MPQGKEQNKDSEPGRRINIYLYPEEEAIASRLMLQYHQKGLTGLVRALLREEFRRRFPDAVQPRTAPVTPLPARGGRE